MDPQNDPRLPIVALRGLPITVAAMLCKYPQPVSQAHLCHLLCYSDKTMSTALHRLQEFQILSHSELGWRVTAHVTLLGFSLPAWLLPADETDALLENPVDACPEDACPEDACPADTCPEDACPADTCPEESFPREKGRKFSDPTSLLTSINSIKLTNNKLKKNLILIEPEQEIESGPGSAPGPEDDPNPKSPEEIEKCHQAAHEVGIGDPKAMSIARLPYTTPKMIKQAVMAALAGNQRIGLAIFWLENNCMIPNNFPGEFQSRKTRDKNDRNKYISGKYSGHIKH